MTPVRTLALLGVLFVASMVFVVMVMQTPHRHIMYKIGGALCVAGDCR